MELISLVLNLLLGGGFIVMVVTLKSTVAKAKAEAETPKIDNTEKIVAMWEKLLDTKSETDGEQIKALQDKMTEFESVVGSLRKEVSKLTKAINEAKKCPGAESCPALKVINNEELIIKN